MYSLLIVDDNKELSSIIKLKLEDEHFSIKTASTGKDGLNIIKSNNIDCIILDYKLPDMSGFEFYQTVVNKFNKLLPVIMISGFRKDEDTIVKALKLGLFDYIIKPFSYEVLIAKVNLAIKLNRKLKDNRIFKSIFIKLFNSHDKIFFMLNNNNKILIFNKAAKKMFGNLLKKKKPFKSLFVSSFENYDKIESALKIAEKHQEKEILLETLIEHQNKDTIHIEWWINRVFDKTENRLIFVFIVGTPFVKKIDLIENMKGTKYFHVYDEMMELNRRLKKLFTQYTPRATWEHILEVLRDEDDEDEENECKQVYVSMLYGDIQNFTTFAERHTPEEVLESLNEIFEMVTDTIYNNGGDVDNFIGDAFFAVFADPFDCVRCAWEISQKLDKINDERMMSSKTPHFIRFGINTGKVVRGDIGSDVRRNNTLVGDAVNLAQRLEAESIPGQILISNSTYELIKDKVEVSDKHEIKVKGKKEPIIAYFVENVK